MTAPEILSENNPFFNAEELLPRPPQQKMAGIIENCLRDQSNAVIEAPTATGKTLAYLIPILQWLEENPHAHAVISTKTLALQDQLLNKDLPLAQKILNTKTPTVCARGSGQYLCTAKLAEKSIAPPDNLREYIKILTVKSSLSNCGQKSDYPEIPENAWQEVSVEEDLCHKKHCPHANTCTFLKARQKLQLARLVITNHAFLLTDLNRKIHSGNELLPQNSALVIDEALDLDKIANNHISWKCSNHSLNKLFESLQKTLRYCRHQQIREASNLISNLRQSSRMFFDNLQNWLTENQIHLPLVLDDSTALPDYFSADMLSAAKIIRTNAIHENNNEVRQKLLLHCHQLEQEALNINNFINSTENNLAIIDQDKRHLNLKKIPLRVDKVLKKHLFSGERPIIMTSATLSIDSDFDFFLKAIGFKAPTHILPSSLQAKQLQLCIPTGLPDPRDEDEFLKASSEIILKEIQSSHGKALVLVNSYRHLDKIYQSLQQELDSTPLLLMKQSKGHDNFDLLERFKKNQNSVLIATGTFWQGIDIPGRSLELLIIVKLPFPVPGDPLETKLLAARGIEEKNFFDLHSLPEAILKLKQGIGRLIRSEKDYGRCLILDSRIHQRQYGQKILRSIRPTSDT